MPAEPTASLELLAGLRTGLPAPRDRQGAFATEPCLAGLELDALAPCDPVLERLAKKIEVPRKLLAYYTPDLARASAPEPVAPAYAVYACAAYLAIADRFGDLKFLNTALKLVDGILGVAMPPELVRWAQCLLERPLPIASHEPAPFSPAPAGALRDIPLTLLADEFCPTTRAYLAYLQAAGLRPAKILFLDPVGASLKLRRLAGLVGRKAVARGLRYVRGRRLAPSALAVRLQAAMPLAYPLAGPFDYLRYVRSVERLPITDLSDPRLLARLAAESCKTFMYTCSGLVPESLLTIPGVKVLHIHPGVVPAVKGTDGLLWSLAVRGLPGVSCFYMNAGIDTGAVIATREFPRPRFQVAAYEVDQLYEALLVAYDPHLRGQLLAEVLANRMDPATLVAEPQDEATGRTYFSMHPDLRRRVISAFLQSPEEGQC